MTKKLYLPLLMAMVVALFSSCSKKTVSYTHLDVYKRQAISVYSCTLHQ